MNKFLLIPFAIIALFIVIGIAVIGQFGPKERDVIGRLTPTIIHKENTNALVIEAPGDPNNTAGAAFSMLMAAYLKLKETTKTTKMEALRARWPKPFETPINEWIGMYAIPVPPSVTQLPQIQSKNGFKLQLREWKYGEVAEILHIGPYSSEDTSTVKLHKFIAESGYTICGPHEEEYLKSFGFFPVSPNKFLTIIRYQVCKADSSKSK